MEGPQGDPLYNDICRLCCYRKPILVPIFEKDPRDLLDILLLLLPSIKFFENDGKPGQVCSDCCNILIKFKSFVETCIKVDSEFDKILKQAEQTNQDIIILENDEKIKVDFNSLKSAKNNKVSQPSAEKKIIKSDIHDEVLRQEDKHILPDELVEVNHSDETDNNFGIENDQQNSREISEIQNSDNNLLPLVEQTLDEIIEESILESSQEQQDPDVSTSEQTVVESQTFTNEIDDIVQEVIVGYSEDIDSDTLIEEAKLLESEISGHEYDSEQASECKMQPPLTDCQQDQPPVKKKRAPRMKGPFICSICSKLYRSGYNLREHLLTHSGVKTYKCDFNKCDKSYYTMRDLVTHSKVHKKIHVCPYCEKCFPVPFHLHRHLQVHTGVKPVQCDICGKLLSTSHYLKLHIKSHKQSNNGELTCVICKLKFKDKWLLRYHCETKHLKPNDKLKCKICDKTMKWKNDYKNHLKEHLPEINIPSISEKIIIALTKPK